MHPQINSLASTKRNPDKPQRADPVEGPIMQDGKA